MPKYELKKVANGQAALRERLWMWWIGKKKENRKWLSFFAYY